MIIDVEDFTKSCKSIGLSPAEKIDACQVSLWPLPTTHGDFQKKNWNDGTLSNMPNHDRSTQR
jgi:hypothetical protein